MISRSKFFGVVGFFPLFALFVVYLPNANSEVKQAAKQVSHRDETIRPAMPDGLYMALDSSPFLLVENGEWKDPYEWVERNTIDALNKKFVREQRFIRFQVNTELAQWEKLNLHALSATDIIKSSKLLNEANFNLKKLAPRISLDKCKDDGKDLWNCKPDMVPTNYISMQTRCNTGRTHFDCPEGIVANEDAVRKLMGANRSRNLLQLDADASSTFIEAKFRELKEPSKALGYQKVSVFISEVFFGPNSQKLLAGHLELESKSKSSWKRKHEWEVEPKSKLALGYVWDVDRARFWYLQDKPRVLSKGAQAICARGVKRNYCPTAIPTGLWSTNGKEYLVMRYEQSVALWHYPVDVPLNDTDLKSVRAAYFEVIELGKPRDERSVFTTRSFIATY